MNIEDKLKCKICGQTFTKIDCVSRHVKHIHDILPQKYFDDYFKTNIDGKCKCCGKDTKFIGLKDGYREYCNKTCFWKVTHNDPNVKAKREQTCLEKYGTTQFMKTEKFIIKRNESLNCDNPFQNENIKNKIKETKLKRYGSETYNNISKMNRTKLEKYGNEWYSNRETALNTIKEKYNINKDITSPFEITEISKKALGHTNNMTKPEKKLNEFLINRKFNFKYAYECNGKNFDFAIFDNNELKILIEIDGLYYHGLLEDSNGKHVRGENDYLRFSKVPEGVKFIVCDENNIEKCFDEILKIFNVDYKTWINEIYNNLPTEFPFPKYEDKRLLCDWNHLCKWEFNKNSRVGYSIINNFHESIYEARCGKNISPVEAWNNKELKIKCIKNRVIYSSNLSSQKIAEGFNVSKIAPKVSVFNPSLARFLIDKYLKEFNSVFDPFSGFSGRMLGVCSLGKQYIGSDINQKHVDESNKIINFLNIKADVKQADIFNSYGEYECLFTCSPYKDKEIWNKNETIMSCDDWIDVCLKNFKCKRYLFVVDETEKYKDKIVDFIQNKSHFSNASEKVILI